MRVEGEGNKHYDQNFCCSLVVSCTYGGIVPIELR